MKKKLRIAVLSGGWSKERSVSIKSGDAVLGALNNDKYDSRIFDPKEDLNLLWQKRGEIDLVLNVLHGRFGEDGRIQGLLEIYGLPFMGSSVLSSAMAMNKRVSKEVYRNMGLLVPKDIILQRGGESSINKIKDVLGTPIVIKPVSEGSSIGISIMENDADIQSGIEKAFEFAEEILVEEYVEGREITGAVLGRSALETLPLIEIVPKESHRFFDFDAKYVAGESNEICPAALDPDISEKASEIVKKAHRSLRCRDWSRTDMMIKKDQIYVLETNTIPGMTETSLVPLAAKGRGWSLGHLLDRMIETCLSEP
ncbi:D-ala D-ala ligase N-terminal domain protein [delta proteobacterium NaphS2]|nr:D-ala D-ala ligase N-terminal domain protein [delta proteobacterium NaphS2]